MQLSRFDLNLLRSLDALLEHRNVTRAADQLFVSQQAMSGALHRLREHFEDELLVRIGRNYELSPRAHSLVLPVRDALLAAQAALNAQPSFDPATARSTFSIAMSDYATFVVLPGLLRRLATEAPGIGCHVEALTQDSFARLEKGDLDFCLTAHGWRLYANYRPTRDIRVEEAFHDDFVCVLDNGHLNANDDISLELYRRLPHNSVRFGKGIATVVEQAWMKSGLEINVAATAPNFSSLIFMLPGTSLIATAQRRLAGILAPILGLKLAECPLPIPPLRENILWHARNEGSPVHRYLRDALVKSCVDCERETGSRQPQGALVVPNRGCDFSAFKKRRMRAETRQHENG
ncbi:LysR family transcriptional regulator [Sphingomonas tabacisoli]|uniref:LysR family transcriptional regulator n=1 Tax=Sphingomonas tabacisoli TaxID=2249466 RepID=A0ABW4I3K8_9SPHN